MASVATRSTDRFGGDLWRCVACGGAAQADASGASVDCLSCGAAYPVRDGVVIVNGGTGEHDNNEVSRAFYNGPLWPKFRFWEWYNFLCNGGERRSREKVLKYLPKGEDLRLLDVAIGDGVYLPWLPRSWAVVGVDVSTAQLDACKPRGLDRDLRLVLGEAENLPVRDGLFDACLSIGGFNYFNDPERALREMARAVKPGGVVVVSDEVPDLTERKVFAHVGMPWIDRWFARKVLRDLGDDFTAVVQKHITMDVAAIARSVLPDARYETIWHGVGYVFVGTVPG